MLTRLKAALQRRAVQLLGRKPLKLDLERAAVSFCFDDFPASAWEAGGPILNMHNVRGTFYLATGLCGQEFDGNRIIKTEMLAEIAEAGHEIGCHTAHHTLLRGLKGHEITTAFDDNAALLEKHLPHEKLVTFAYPYGELSLGAKRVATQRFAACRGIWAGVNAGTIDLGLLSSVCLEPHILADRDPASWVAEAVRQKGWLIFTTHDVSETPGPFGTTPGLLDSAVSAAITAGCEILPVKNALGLAAYGRMATS